MSGGELGVGSGEVGCPSWFSMLIPGLPARPGERALALTLSLGTQQLCDLGQVSVFFLMCE